MTLRLFILQAHYRKPLDFTSQALNATSIGWKGLNLALSCGLNYGENLGWGIGESNLKNVAKFIDKRIKEQWKDKYENFIAAMDDDLNTSAAIAVLFDLAGPLRSLANRLERGEKEVQFKDNSELLFSRWLCLSHLAAVLGFHAERDNEEMSDTTSRISDQEIKIAIEKRAKAKLHKDFIKADLIRNELKESGIELIDQARGITEWKRV